MCVLLNAYCQANTELCGTTYALSKESASELLTGEHCCQKLMPIKETLPADPGIAHDRRCARAFRGVLVSTKPVKKRCSCRDAQWQGKEDQSEGPWGVEAVHLPVDGRHVVGG